MMRKSDGLGQMCLFATLDGLAHLKQHQTHPNLENSLPRLKHRSQATLDARFSFHTLIYQKDDSFWSSQKSITAPDEECGRGGIRYISDR